MNTPTEALGGQAGAMDRMYRFQRHIYDATRRYYLLGRDEMLDRLAPPPSGSILEIGCGTGRNLVGAAKRYPDARLFGIDISQEMLTSALTSIDCAGLSRRATLAAADATGFNAYASLGRARFDRVYFSYTLSMIPDWRQALDHALTLLAPNGELHIADFGQCDALPAPVRRSLVHWLSLFHVTPHVGLRGALIDLSRQREAALRFESLYRGYACIAAIRPLAAAPRQQVVQAA